MEPLVTLDQVGYMIDGQHILRDISFDIHEGQIISLIGYNGSGKSTLLQMML
jgi:ABC-type Mn2+/Zn2+ transport system ATPase subunit